MKQLSFAVAVAAALCALSSAPAQAQCSSLTTLFNWNSIGGVGGQVFFDVNVINPAGITVTKLDTNTTVFTGTAVAMDIYEISGTYAGNEANQSAWTLVASGTGVTAGGNNPTVIDFADFALPAGSHGLSLVWTTGTVHSYTIGTGSNQNYSNADLAIATGAAQNVPWTNPVLSPRVWNGRIHYCIGGSTGPSVYCTAGTSAAGCSASIAANGNPNVSHSAPCQITISNLDGQRAGIVFYALTPLPQPWCPAGGGTSFLCVKTPTMRTPVQNSGGTAGQCNGTLTLNWNAFQLASPGALGQPWAAGNNAYVQGWYRDPPACKTTSLSDAIKLTYLP